ncbi:hypothetical protein P872_24215 [Rhodonellum psychrophilum GCM71 = DSM 17998]|uniref:Uncharacterized protein n=1 Tax=Rhodonellum psychrophilum GCM71 = DSM 17998 TaxID=1123057 RepID=U5C8K2_9BACT|nr:hypothetical protein P872_24215 [Rhodonellum psychrophilum GCM71 = DSM 17998]
MDHDFLNPRKLTIIDGRLPGMIFSKRMLSVLGI